MTAPSLTHSPSNATHSVDSLKRKLAKDSELHRTDNLRIMQVRE